MRKQIFIAQNIKDKAKLFHNQLCYKVSQTFLQPLDNTFAADSVHFKIFPEFYDLLILAKNG